MLTRSVLPHIQMTKLTGEHHLVHEPAHMKKSKARPRLKKSSQWSESRARVSATHSTDDDARDISPCPVRRDSVLQDPAKGHINSASSGKHDVAQHRNGTRLPRLDASHVTPGSGDNSDKVFGTCESSRASKLGRCNSEFYNLSHKHTGHNTTKRKNSFREFKASLFQDSVRSSENSEGVNSILDKDYSFVDDVNTAKDLNTFTPYFSQWKISGFHYDKVILSKLADMSETKEVTPEFVQYIKERDAALAEKNKAESELRQTQCKLYDALQMIEKLEKKVSEASDTKNKSGGGQAKATGAAKKPPATNTKKKSTGQQSNGHSLKAGASTTSSSGVSSGRNSLISSARTTVGLYHPPVASIEPVTDSRDYYAKLSDKFPTLSMFTVLDAEKKFMKADADSSGYIDIDELDKVLSDTVGMFTQKQLEEIMKEIDTDDSQTLDFLEVLTVLYKLVSKRKTNLPNSVQQNYTKTCNVQ